MRQNQPNSEAGLENGQLRGKNVDNMQKRDGAEKSLHGECGRPNIASKELIIADSQEEPVILG